MDQSILEMQRYFIDHTTIGIAMIRDNRIVMANQRLAELLGYSDAKELIGLPTSHFYSSITDVDLHVDDEASSQSQDIVAMSGIELSNKSGKRIWLDIAISVFRDQDTEHAENAAIWTFQDVTKTYELQKKLAHAAMHDSLTSLPNRRALEDYLIRVVDRAHRENTVFYVGMIDLDNFKYVNDRFGHEAGDRLLKNFCERMQNCLRKGDFLSRWGGDEFVIVLEFHDPDSSIGELAALLAFMHKAVETPYTIYAEISVEMGMSMGLAVFPTHGQDGNQLLREADAAMYEIKMKKWTRDTWWQLGKSEDASTADQMPQILFPIDEIVEEFYSYVYHHPATKEIFSRLEPEEYNRLKNSAIHHLDFLLNQRTDLEEIRRRSERIGEIHALVGVNGDLMSQATAIYVQVVTKIVSEYPVVNKSQLMLMLQNRLQIDLETQLQAIENTMMQYLMIFNRPLSPHSESAPVEWHDELEALGNLPGIKGVLWIGLHSQKGFVVVDAAGCYGKELAKSLTLPDIKAVPDSTSEKGQSLLAEAWFSGKISSSSAYLNDPRFQIWHDIFRQFGIRSVLMVPLLGKDRNPMAVIGLYGAFTKQFESPWMKVFAKGLQFFGHERWLYHSGTGESIPSEQAKEYRSQLFNGGLTLYMQPIVDLQSGATTKYEGLARLIQNDGKVLAPAAFLPLLGEVEMNRLFQLGLEQGIAALKLWGDEEEPNQISINLPPTTLLNGEMIDWIQSTLKGHGVPPERVVMELLETQGFDLESLANPLAQLSEMGIQLAMDDFGSGENNFLRMTVCSFDIVKIDRGLWRTLENHPLSTLNLLGSLIQIGNDFGWSVVVEGLETLDMAEAVAMLGARYGQGYYLARPMPIDDVAKWKKEFVFALRPDRILTRLGALAYMMRYGRVNQINELREEESPMIRFFMEQGWLDSEAMVWYRQLHGGTVDFVQFKRLLKWLEDKVKEEYRAVRATKAGA